MPLYYQSIKQLLRHHRCRLRGGSAGALRLRLRLKRGRRFLSLGENERSSKGRSRDLIYRCTLSHLLTSTQTHNNLLQRTLPLTMNTGTMRISAGQPFKMVGRSTGITARRVCLDGKQTSISRLASCNPDSYPLVATTVSVHSPSSFASDPAVIEINQLSLPLVRLNFLLLVTQPHPIPYPPINMV